MQSKNEKAETDYNEDIGIQYSEKTDLGEHTVS